MGRVVTSGSLAGVIVSPLAWNVRYVGLIPARGTIFPIFITPTKLVAVTRILYKFHTVCLLNLHRLCLYMDIACMYVIVNIRRLKFMGGGTNVVVYLDISGKELQRQVGVSRVVISGSLGGVMIRTLA